MKEIHAIYENGVFRPIGPVELPEGAEVILDLREDETNAEPIGASKDHAWDAVYEILGRRFHSGHTDTAERHNEHQP